jgi:glycosyltransferase involved in cell wall biosynthesis
LRASDSVLPQTVPADEFIVVDDGSSDGSAEAIRSRYASRIEVFWQENLGVSAARMRGLEETRGEWITFLDSDDEWLPTKLERQSRFWMLSARTFAPLFALKTKLCFVSEPLVKIDRTTSRPRLIELFSQKSEKMFSSTEHMFRKWLSMPEMTDPEVRSRICESLRNLYVDWTIRKLYQFKFFEAFAKTRQARGTGESYSHILSKLAFRAARKICAPLT